MVFRRNCVVVERWQAFPGGLEGKASTCNAGDPGSFPESEDPLEKKMTPHSSTLAWKIPWTEEPGRLQSMGSQRVGHDWVTSLHFRKMTKLFLIFITLFPLLTFPFDSFLCFKSPFFPTAQPLVTIILVSVTMS